MSGAAGKKTHPLTRERRKQQTFPLMYDSKAPFEDTIVPLVFVIARTSVVLPELASPFLEEP